MQPDYIVSTLVPAPLHTTASLSEFVAPESVCTFVPPSHPFSPGLQKFRDGVRQWLAEHPDGFTMTADTRTLTRTLLRAENGPEGLGPLKWMYLSFQVWQEEGYCAWTFLYRSQRERISVYEFPKDPKLGVLADFFKSWTKRESGHRRVCGLNVLRYIPRRRLTFEVFTPATAQEKILGKFVQPDEVGRLFDRLHHLRQSFPGPSFCIPKVLRVERNVGLFYQTKEAGQDLSTVLTVENLTSSLRQVGRIQAEIHQLSIQSAVTWDYQAYIDRVEHDVQWIGSFLPDQKERLENVLRTWSSHRPTLQEDDFVFCHGDFRTPHLLVRDHQPWVVIDFDGCLRADRHWEMAWFIASLKRDVPFLTAALTQPNRRWDQWLQEAIAAYLEGYLGQCPQGFSQARLDWFLVAAEIHYAARSFQRDLADPLTLKHTLELVQDAHTVSIWDKPIENIPIPPCQAKSPNDRS